MKTSLFLAMAVFFILPLSARAQEVPSPWSVDIEGGWAVPLSPSSLTDNQSTGSHFGLRLRKKSDSDWSFGGSLRRQTLPGKDGFPRRISQPITFDSYYSIHETILTNTYGLMSLGLSRNSLEGLGPARRWTKMTFGLGLGWDRYITDLHRLGLELTYRYYGGAGGGDKNYHILSIAGVFRFFIPDSWVF